MKKNLLLTLLLVIISIVLLLGCNKEQVVTQGTLSIWTQMEGVEPDVFDEMVTSFTDLYPEIKVEVQHYETEDLRNNFQNAAVSGKGPDLIYGPADNIGVFSTFKGGIIKEDLKSLFGNEFLGMFLPAALDNFEYKGKLWGIPDRIGNHLMLIVNTELVKNIPSDFETVFNTNEFKETEYPLAFNASEPFWLAAFYGGYGGRIFMPGSTEPDLDNEAMVKTLTFIKKLQDDGMIAPGLDSDTAHQLFIEGKSTMLINGDWSIGEYRDTMKSFVTAPIPSLPGGDFPRPFKSSKGFSISSNARGDQQALAVQFLKHFYTVENQQKWSDDCKIFSSNNIVFGKLNQSNDPVIQGSLAQLSYGEKMPVVPELRAIWDAMRPNLEAVLTGSKTPEEAAEAMQKEAESSIRAMTGQ
jgi:arabinogalactan oligomer/maltooligosaccharide transport system substrate-binding protein